MNQPNVRIGILCAIAVFFIWSSFFVFSRLAVTGVLTPYDITALRFLVAGIIVLPFAWRWWPRHLSPTGQWVMAACGPGAIYSLVMYAGLSQAPVAYAGVFANGSLPVFSALLILAVKRAAPSIKQMLGIAIILSGSALLSLPGLADAGDNVMQGIALFLTASVVLSIYLFGVQFWRVTPQQALALITLPNAVLYLPLWFFFLPSGIEQASVQEVAFQAAFQGLGPGFFAVLLFATATINLGATATASFSAAVPAGAALLAMPVLGEFPTPLAWGGVLIVSIGLAVLLVRRR
ncbi:MAG: DMT family transporter [Burkholderiaceae bacterium]